MHCIVGTLILLSLVQADDTPPVVRTTEAKLLLMGNWADPTILKDGDDYYMTHSSFDFQPGLLIWHSRDLRKWTPIARATINQPGDIYAPELIKHDGRYFIYYPAKGGISVVTADSPKGPWSTPKLMGVDSIDPGHVVDADGRRFLHYMGGNAVPLAADGVQVDGKAQHIYKGWQFPSDWATEGMCLESPKFTARNGWYYLTSAEGGTAGPATSHMVVSARSRNPMGPWENSPFNPIIHTWSREETWWSKGHGTLVEGPDKQWYCVLHGYRNGYRSLGRCTLIEPIDWTADGWFKVSERWPAGWDAPVVVDMPLSDSFQGKELGLQWQFFKKVDPERFTVGDGTLTLKALGAHPGDSYPATVMPAHRSYEIEVDVEMEGDGTAGLMLFYAQSKYVGLGVDKSGAVMRVQKGFDVFGKGTPLAQLKGRAKLRIVNAKQDVVVYYADAAGRWQPVPSALDVSGANTSNAGGWACLRPALFASGSGTARFHTFTYRPLEQ